MLHDAQNTVGEEATKDQAASESLEASFTSATDYASSGQPECTRAEAEFTQVKERMLGGQAVWMAFQVMWAFVVHGLDARK